MYKLPLTLAIVIITVFGLLHLGMALYEPAWWMWRESRLCSDDDAVRNDAIEKIVGKGCTSIPRIRRWLKSSNSRILLGACLVLEKMEGDLWEEALPELTIILHEPPSARTNAVANLITKKGYAFSCIGRQRMIWHNFKNDSRAKMNLCLYLLSDSSCEVRASAVNELGKVGDAYAVDPLITRFNNDSSCTVRSNAVCALGKLGYSRAVKPLLKALEDNSDSMRGLRKKAALALGKIGDKRAVGPLVIAIENDPSAYVRKGAIEALLVLDNQSAVGPLIKALGHDSDDDIRARAARYLGMLGDSRAINPLVEVLNNDPDSYVRKCAKRAACKCCPPGTFLAMDTKKRKYFLRK